MSRKNIIVAIFAVLAISVIATSKPTQQSLQQAQPVAQVTAQPSAYHGWTTNQLEESEERFQAGAKSTRAQAKCAIGIMASVATYAQTTGPEGQKWAEDTNQSIVNQCHT